MEEDLRTGLLAHAPLAALVGARMSPGKRDQAGDLPAVVYHRISGGRVYSQDGRTKLVDSRVQLDCWGASYASAKAVATAIVAAADTVTGTTVGGTYFALLRVDAERDEWDPAEPGGGERRVMLDLLIWHDEP